MKKAKRPLRKLKTAVKTRWSRSVGQTDTERAGLTGGGRAVAGENGSRGAFFDGVTRLRALRARFSEAHRAGREALARRDYSALYGSMRTESAIIDEQQRVIIELRLLLRLEG